MKKKAIFQTFLSVTFTLCTQFAFTQNTWTGATNQNWHEPTNWSFGHVPTTSEEVLINMLPEVLIEQNSNAVAKSIRIKTSGILTIEQGGSLVIESPGFSVMTIELEGQFNNSGIFTILDGGDPTFTTAIFLNGGNCNNFSTGVFTIENTDSHSPAITNLGSFKNWGQMIIGKAGKLIAVQGIINGGTEFRNKQGGVITINNTGGAGLYNASTFINDGTIHIGNGGANSIGHDGLLNQRIFTNNGNLFISNTNGNGLTNSGFTDSKFTNNSLVEINHCLKSGCFNDGLATFTNNQIIRIGNTGTIQETGLVSSGARWDNNGNGLISIDNCGGDGFEIEGFGEGDNFGQIIIGSTGAITGIGFMNGTGSENFPFINQSTAYLPSTIPEGVHTSIQVLLQCTIMVSY